MVTRRDRHFRLCHLIASMQIEEAMPIKRSIPSAFTLLKAEYGFIGTRQQVLAAAHDAAAEGTFV